MIVVGLDFRERRDKNRTGPVRNIQFELAGLLSLWWGGKQRVQVETQGFREKLNRIAQGPN